MNVKMSSRVIVTGYIVMFIFVFEMFLSTKSPVAAQKVLSYAAVNMVSGIIYELTEVQFQTSRDSSFYTFYSNFTSNKLRLKLPPNKSYLVMDIPLEQINEIVTEEDRNTISVTLQNGQIIKGSWSSMWTGDGYVARLQANMQVEGYSSKLEMPCGQITKIVFKKKPDNTITAIVITADGKNYQNLYNPKFIIENGDSRGDRFATDVLAFKVNDATLEIPVDDIAAIDRRSEQHLLTLKSGKSIAGKAYFLLTGKTETYGRQADFKAGFDIEYVSFVDRSTLEQSLKSSKPKKSTSLETGTTAEKPKVDSTSKIQSLPNKSASIAEIKNILPPFEIQLQGSNEVRVKNPNEFSVNVGIRQANLGNNFTVPSGGMTSVKAPNGKFDIYFVYSDKPDALFNGDSFSLENNGVEIHLVKVVGGNYDIKRVK